MRESTRSLAWCTRNMWSKRWNPRNSEVFENFQCSTRWFFFSPCPVTSPTCKPISSRKFIPSLVWVSNRCLRVSVLGGVPEDFSNRNHAWCQKVFYAHKKTRYLIMVYDALETVSTLSDFPLLRNMQRRRCKGLAEIFNMLREPGGRLFVPVRRTDDLCRLRSVFSSTALAHSARHKVQELRCQIKTQIDVVIFLYWSTTVLLDVEL